MTSAYRTLQQPARRKFIRQTSAVAVASLGAPYIWAQGKTDDTLVVNSFGGEYQEGTLTAYCAVEGIPHVELNGHILIPLQNIASLHCSSRCDAPEPDWPPRGLAESEGDT